MPSLRKFIITSNMEAITRKPINKIIKDYLYEHGIKSSMLAKAIGEHSGNLARKLNNDLDTSLIWKISDALDHDFFNDLSMQFKPALTTADIKAPDDLSDTMKQLLKEVVKQNTLLIQKSRVEGNHISQQAVLPLG